MQIKEAVIHMDDLADLDKENYYVHLMLDEIGIVDTEVVDLKLKVEVDHVPDVYNYVKDLVIVMRNVYLKVDLVVDLAFDSDYSMINGYGTVQD